MPERLFADDLTSRDGVTVIPRHVFASRHFHYKAGEHVVFGGPTQKGKTTLAFDLLAHVATPDLPAYVAVSKPSDKTSRERGKALGFRRVAEWPPTKQLKEYFGEKPRGYLVWPKFGDIDADIDNATKVTARLLGDRYTAGVKNQKGILVLDDTMVKSKIMGLDRQMTTIIAMAGAMGIGEWVFVQKPTDSGRTSLWSYGNSEHLFLAYDPVSTNRDRYDEIGGFDPDFVGELVLRLKGHPYQFVYLKRTEGYCCIVDSR